MSNNSQDDHMLPSPQGGAQLQHLQNSGSAGQTLKGDEPSSAPIDNNHAGKGDNHSQEYAMVHDLPISAEDIDLIEKEWVTKAKAIVASTVGNPRRQSIELNKAKAQYISKRFNKELPQHDK